MNSSGAALETRHSIPVVDWRSGRIRFDLPHESGSAPTWSLVICGDWAPQARFFARVPNNPLDVYGDLLPVLYEADLAAVNLVCVISDGELVRAVKDGSVGKAPDWAIRLLINWQAF